MTAGIWPVIWPVMCADALCCAENGVRAQILRFLKKGIEARAVLFHIMLKTIKKLPIWFRKINFSFISEFMYFDS